MNTRTISAYNLARGTLLNSKLTLADSGNQPLKLLDIVVSGMGMDPTAGLWLSPLHAIPAVPRVFPFDLIYLDKEYRVLNTAEMGPGIDFPPFHPEVSSALVLPSDTLHRTKTTSGDHLIVCASNDLEAMLAASSLPAPDASDPIRPSAAPPAAPNRARPGTIELTPERPLPPAAPATAFDQSVLTAVAKVAAARELPPGPSMDVTEAVLDSPRQFPRTVIEHRIDPEDLFSNWVGTAPPPSTAHRTAPPEPPKPAISAAPAQPAAPEPPKQNGRKIKPPAETRAGSTDTVAPKPKSKPAPSAPDRPGTVAKSRPDDSVRPNSPVPSRTPVPQTSATTFTASSFGMWQISAPTAVAPMTGAKSPQTPVKAPAEAKPAPSGKTSAPAPMKASESVAGQEVKNPPSPPPVTSRTDPAALPESAAIPPKPKIRDTSSTEFHRPGDFVASLQEKLERVQQFKPSPAENALEPQAPSPHTADPAPLSSLAQAALPAAKPASPPALKSTAAAQPTAPAKPKPEPAPSGFRSKFRQWLHPTSSPSDRRRASRRYVPGMVAHYFTGGAPKPKNVADISMSGMYLLTDDRWMPGTMIQMTLQKPCASGEKKQSINVLSRIVRRGSDGVAIEFIMPEALPHISHDIQPSQATDKFALARFL